jgi:outer membrane biosynthesis protein TonB
LVLHLLIFGTYRAGNKLGWWQSAHWPKWLQSSRMLTEALKKKDTPPPLQEAPLMFVDVSPAQATTEAPKDARFYSSKNSLAANPDATKDTGQPKIDGTQKQAVKTQDVPHEKFVPLQPSAPPLPAAPPKPEEPPKPTEQPKPPEPPKPPEQPKPAEQQPKPAEQDVKPKPTQPPGDLAMAKPDTTLRRDAGQTETPRPRPRTIAEARARQQPLPGEKMLQEGGVRRRLELTSLDAKATPYGAYDEALVEAISQRWYTLLDERDYASDGRGVVVVQFTLQYDGHITDVSVAEHTVNDVLTYLCQKAIQDPAPYEPWPSEMRRVLGDVRHIQFTFFYN